jgi:hypothetical protein
MKNWLTAITRENAEAHSAPGGEKIPAGMAVLCEDNSGWVGTSNGDCFSGRPALYPTAQAEAIAYAVNLMRMRGWDEMAHHFPGFDAAAPPECMRYLFGMEAAR